MSITEPFFVNWEGRPALLTSREAWAVIRGAWKSVDPLEVDDSGRAVSADTFARLFPSLPPLPADAFASDPE